MPGENVGRATRVIWIPVIIVWIVHPFLTAFLSSPPRILWPLYAIQKWGWPVLMIVVVCLILTLCCWKAMGRNWRMGIDPAERNPLIDIGPFAYVRHPIYALSLVMMLSTVVVLPSPLMIAAGMIHIAFLIWESRREERHMLRIHGASYEIYRRIVPRFIPHIPHRAKLPAHK